MIFGRAKVVSTSEPKIEIKEADAPPPETPQPETPPPETDDTTPPPKVDDDAAKEAAKERERKRIADARQRGLEEGIEQGKGYKLDDWPQEDKSYGSGNWLIDKLGLENEYLQGPVQLAESLSAIPLRLATRGLKAIPEQVFSAKGARYDDRPEKEITLGHDPEQVAALTPGDEVPLREGGTDVRIASQLKVRPDFAPSQSLDDVMPTLQDDTLSLQEKIQTLEAIVAANPAVVTPGSSGLPADMPAYDVEEALKNKEPVENTQARRQAEDMLLILNNAKQELSNIRDKRARLKGTVTAPPTEEAEPEPEPEPEAASGAALESPSTPSVESDRWDSVREKRLKKLDEYKPGAGEYRSDRPIPNSSSEPVSTEPVRPRVSTPAPLPRKKPETSATEDKTETSAAKSMTDFYNYPVRSRAGRREKHPVTGKPGEHHGDDLVAPKDTPQPALLAGKVTNAGYHPDMGNYIIIDHDNGMQTRHFHGSNETPRFKVGDRVEAGDTVLLTGTSGRSTGVHSHIEVWGDPDKHDELRIPGMKITRGGKVSLNMTDVLDYLNAQASR